MIHQSASRWHGTPAGVDDASCTTRTGQVTGFLGPDGEGTSTTVRMIVGLDYPTSRRVTGNGARWAEQRPAATGRGPSRGQGRFSNLVDTRATPLTARSES